MDESRIHEVSDKTSIDFSIAKGKFSMEPTMKTSWRPLLFATYVHIYRVSVCFFCFFFLSFEIDLDLQVEFAF